MATIEVGMALVFGRAVQNHTTSLNVWSVVLGQQWWAATLVGSAADFAFIWAAGKYFGRLVCALCVVHGLAIGGFEIVPSTSGRGPTPPCQARSFFSMGGG